METVDPVVVTLEAAVPDRKDVVAKVFNLKGKANLRLLEMTKPVEATVEATPPPYREPLSPGLPSAVRKMIEQERELADKKFAGEVREADTQARRDTKEKVRENQPEIDLTTQIRDEVGKMDRFVAEQADIEKSFGEIRGADKRTEFVVDNVPSILWANYGVSSDVIAEKRPLISVHQYSNPLAKEFVELEDGLKKYGVVERDRIQKEMARGAAAESVQEDIGDMGAQLLEAKAGRTAAEARVKELEEQLRAKTEQAEELKRQLVEAERVNDEIQKKLNEETEKRKFVTSEMQKILDIANRERDEAVVAQEAARATQEHAEFRAPTLKDSFDNWWKDASGRISKGNPFVLGTVGGYVINVGVSFGLEAVTMIPGTKEVTTGVMTTLALLAEMATQTQERINKMRTNYPNVAKLIDGGLLGNAVASATIAAVDMISAATQVVEAAPQATNAASEAPKAATTGGGENLDDYAARLKRAQEAAADAARRAADLARGQGMDQLGQRTAEYVVQGGEGWSQVAKKLFGVEGQEAYKKGLELIDMNLDSLVKNALEHGHREAADAYRWLAEAYRAGNTDVLTSEAWGKVKDSWFVDAGQVFKYRMVK